MDSKEGCFLGYKTNLSRVKHLTQHCEMHHLEGRTRKSSKTTIWLHQTKNDKQEGKKNYIKKR